MKILFTICGIILLVVLTACSGSGDENTAAAAQAQTAIIEAGDEVEPTSGDIHSEDTGSSAPQMNGNNAETLQSVPSAEAAADAEVTSTPAQLQSGDNGSSAELDESYTGALPVQTQLALGTMLLEDSDLAVDGAQAKALLPLWRAVLSLTTSGTAADAEITAVINQIQADMMTEQITAIVDMQLTQEAMRSLVQEGVVAIDVGDVKRGSTDDVAGSGARGAGPLGGGGDALAGQSDPALQATRQAEGGGNSLLNQAITSAVVQLLELKTI